MTTIDPAARAVIAAHAQSPNAPAAKHPLARLSAGVRLGVDTTDVGRVGDAANEVMQRVASLMADLEAAVAEVQSLANAGAEAKNAAQSRVDSILRSIDAAANTQGPDAPFTPTTQPAFTVANVNDYVSNLRVTGAKVEPGSSHDVVLTVVQSAQQGALVLDFGGGQLDLAGANIDDPTASFVVEIGGVGGAVELNFTSGVTVGTMAATINTYSDVTGTKATVIGGRIWLESANLGADEFVSVRVIDDGGASGAGVMTTNTDNVFGVGGPGSQTIAFADAANVIDHGQNLIGTINGESASSNGAFLQFQSAALSFTATLSRTLAQTTSHWHLFTLSGNGQGSNAAADSSGQPTEAASAFDALREMRERLLGASGGAPPIAGANHRNAQDMLG